MTMFLDVPDEILMFIGRYFGIEDFVLLLVTGGLPKSFTDHARNGVAKIKKIQKWWNHVKFPSPFDASWCLTEEHQWSCRLGEKMYKRFLKVRYPITYVHGHSITLAYRLVESSDEAQIYDCVRFDYFVPSVSPLEGGFCLNGSLSSWKELVSLAGSEDLGAIGY